MEQTLNVVDIGALRGCHVQSPTEPDSCLWCDDAWPCRVLALCIEVETLRAREVGPVWTLGALGLCGPP